MSVNLLWANLVAYSLQIGLLVGLAGFVPAALRLAPARRPAGLLARIAGGLPAASVGAAVEAGGGRHRAGFHLRGGVVPVQSAPRRSLPPASEIALLLLAAGRAGSPGLAGGGILEAAANTGAIPCRSNRVFLERRGRPADFRRSGQPGDIRRAKTRGSAARAVSGVRRAYAGSHPLPRDSARAAPRLAVHGGGGVGARGLLVPSGHSGGCWARLAWRASRRWTYRWSRSPSRAKHTWMRCWRSPAPGRGSTWPRRRCSCASGT